MNIFKEQYRNSFEKSDFFKNGRLIFMGGGPDKPEPPAAPKAPEGPKGAPGADKGAPKEPITDKEFHKHKDRYEKHIAALPKDKPKIIDGLKKGFEDRFIKIKEDYGKLVGHYEAQKNPKKAGS